MKRPAILKIRIVKTRTRGARQGDSQAGMSLIELMFACFVLVVGMMGSLAMILMAISSNARNKFDTTGTMVAQMVIEQINVMPTNQIVPGTTTPVTSIQIRDCDGSRAAGSSTNWTINVVAGGAQTLASNGNIDYAGQTYAAVPAGYKMQYYTCGDIAYDVRWNVQQLTGLTRLITVSARQQVFSQNRVQLFAPPVTLRTISGP